MAEPEKEDDSPDPEPDPEKVGEDFHSAIERIRSKLSDLFGLPVTFSHIIPRGFSMPALITLFAACNHTRRPGDEVLTAHDASLDPVCRSRRRIEWPSYDLTDNLYQFDRDYNSVSKRPGRGEVRCLPSPASEQWGVPEWIVEGLEDQSH
jgi:hypothetical protein